LRIQAVVGMVSECHYILSFYLSIFTKKLKGASVDYILPVLLQSFSWIPLFFIMRGQVQIKYRNLQMLPRDFQSHSVSSFAAKSLFSMRRISSNQHLLNFTVELCTYVYIKYHQTGDGGRIEYDTSERVNDDAVQRLARKTGFVE